MLKLGGPLWVGRNQHDQAEGCPEDRQELKQDEPPEFGPTCAAREIQHVGIAATNGPKKSHERQSFSPDRASSSPADMRSRLWPERGIGVERLRFLNKAA